MQIKPSIVVTAIPTKLLDMAVHCEASSLLGQLETLGPGGAAAAVRQRQVTAADVVETGYASCQQGRRNQC